MSKYSYGIASILLPFCERLPLLENVFLGCCFNFVKIEKMNAFIDEEEKRRYWEFQRTAGLVAYLILKKKQEGRIRRKRSIWAKP